MRPKGLEQDALDTGQPGLGSSGQDFGRQTLAPCRIEMGACLVEQQKRRNTALPAQRPRLGQRQRQDQGLLFTGRAVAGRLVLVPVPGQQFRAVRAPGQRASGGRVPSTPLAQGKRKGIFCRRHILSGGQTGLDGAVQNQVGLREYAAGAGVDLALKPDQGVKPGSGDGHAIAGHLAFQRIQPRRVGASVIEQSLAP